MYHVNSFAFHGFSIVLTRTWTNARNDPHGFFFIWKSKILMLGFSSLFDLLKSSAKFLWKINTMDDKGCLWKIYVPICAYLRYCWPRKLVSQNFKILEMYSTSWMSCITSILWCFLFCPLCCAVYTFLLFFYLLKSSVKFLWKINSMDDKSCLWNIHVPIGAEYR